MQGWLSDYGYGVERNGRYDPATTEVVAAFQRHFRPARIDGIADPSTILTLRRLLAARDRAAAPNQPPVPGPEEAAEGLFGRPLTPDA